MTQLRTRTAPKAAALTLVAAVGLSACTMGHDAGGKSASSSPHRSGTSAPASTSSSSQELTAEEAFSKTQDFVSSTTSTSVEMHGLTDHQDSTFLLSGELDNDPTKTHAVMGTNGTADLITIGQDLYVKGDKSYWKKAASASEETAGRLSGKWFKAPKSSLGSDVNSLTPKAVTSEITDDNGTLASKFQTSSATLKKATYQNQSAYELTGDDGKTKVWCSADGKFTLFKVEQPDDPEDFSDATFRGWNAKANITAPKGAISLPGKKGRGKGAGAGSDGAART